LRPVESKDHGNRGRSGDPLNHARGMARRGPAGRGADRPGKAGQGKVNREGGFWAN
jgi:hypothetical protein